MDTLPAIYNTPSAAPAPLAPTWGETGRAAFGLENDVVNFYNSVTEPYEKPDLNFKPLDEFLSRDLPDEWASPLMRSVNLNDFNRRLAKVQAEEKNKAILAASGWAGTVAAIGAGVLSPTMFIPFIGQGRRGMAFAEVLGLAAAGATAQEATLYYSQETRTAAESFTNIGAQTLLGGLLGGAWLGLSKEGRLRLAGDVEVRQRFVDIPTVVSDVGRVERSAKLVDEVTPDEALALLRAPDRFGRDAQAAADAIVEPAPIDGMVRLYTTAGPELSVSGVRAFTDREVAASIIGSKLHYIDVPSSDIRVAVEPGKVVAEVELAPSEVAYVKAIYKGSDPTSKIGKELKARADEPRADMGALPGKEAIPISGKDAEAVGAAPSKFRNTSGPEVAKTRIGQAVMDTMGPLFPTYRMQTSMFPSLRDAAYKLESAGIRQGGLNVIEPSASGGSVASRILAHDPNIATFLTRLDESFYHYIYGKASKDSNMLRSAMLQLRSRFGTLPEGKMDFNEFNAATYDGLSTGKVVPGTETAVSALRDFYAYYNNLHKEYHAEMLAAGLHVPPLYKELLEGELGKGVTGYANQNYDTQLINSRAQEFLNEFGDFYRGTMEESFQRDHGRMLKKKASLEFLHRVAGLSAEERGALYDEHIAAIEALDELPELVQYNAERLELRQRAKNEGWAPEQLKEAAKAMQDNLPAETTQLLEERRALRSTANSLRKLGGKSMQDAAKFGAEAKKMNTLLDQMFRTTIPAIEAFDKSMAKLIAGDEKLFAKLEAAVQKAATILAQRAKQHAKIMGSSRTGFASKARVMDKLEKAQLHYDGALGTLASEGWRKLPFQERLSYLNLLREDAIADARELAKTRAIRAAEAEEKVTAAEEKMLTPEEMTKEVASIEKQLDNLEADFNDKWRGRGERSGDPSLGKPDFAEEALETAMALQQSLTVSHAVPSFFAIRQAERGPQLMRMLALPYELKQKWLVKDLERNVRSYDRAMGPDLEIWRAFDGSVNGKSALDQMVKEANNLQLLMSQSTHVKLPKGWAENVESFFSRVKAGLEDFGARTDLYLDQKNFSNEAGPGFVPLTPALREKITEFIKNSLKDQTRNFDIAIQRLRATRLVPEDADSIMWRTGRFIKNMNILTMLGSVIPASISDISRPMWQYGVMGTMKQAWLPFIAGLKTESGKTYRVRAREINHQIGLNNEVILHGRARDVLDLADDTFAGKNMVERGVGFLSRKAGIISMFSFWNDAMKTLAGATVHSALGVYIPRVAEAIAANKEFTGDLLSMRSHLRDLGLRDIDIIRIGKMMELPEGMEKFSNGGFLPNVDKWTDPAAFRAYSAALHTMVNKLIVRPGLERPNWMDENMGYSLVGQFSSFTFASTSRMMMSAAQGNDPYLIQGAMASLAFGALSYYTWAVSTGGQNLERANKLSPEDWIYEAVDRSGLLGVLSIPQRFGEQIPMLNQYAIFGGEDKPYRRPTGVLGTLFGPTMGQAEKAVEVIKNIDDPEKRARNLKLLFQLFVPYQNHFLFRRAFENLRESMQ